MRRHFDSEPKVSIKDTPSNTKVALTSIQLTSDYSVTGWKQIIIIIIIMIVLSERQEVLDYLKGR